MPKKITNLKTSIAAKDKNTEHYLAFGEAAKAWKERWEAARAKLLEDEAAADPAIMQECQAIFAEYHPIATQYLQTEYARCTRCHWPELMNHSLLDKDMYDHAQKQLDQYLQGHGSPTRFPPGAEVWQQLFERAEQRRLNEPGFVHPSVVNFGPGPLQLWRESLPQPQAAEEAAVAAGPAASSSEDAPPGDI